MKQLRLPIFNSKIKYYNLRIVPSEVVFNEVMQFKKQFEYLHGKLPLSGSKAHITLAAFKMNSKYQDDLIQVFKQLSKRATFKLSISGFDAFEKSRTLYLKVSKSNSLETIQQDVQLIHNEQFKRKLKSLVIPDKPHITISKAKSRKMLDESLKHFQKYDYSKQISVDQITLVSRSKYKTWDWEHHIGLS